MKSRWNILPVLTLALCLTSCGGPSDSSATPTDTKEAADTPAGNGDGATTPQKSITTKPGSIEDLAKRLQADKDRLDKAADPSSEPKEITSLKNTAGAFFKALIGSDDGAVQGYLMADADIDAYFPTDATVLKSGRNSSNEVNRRELKKLVKGLETSVGDVEVNGVITQNGRLSARIVDIPFRAGGLKGRVKVSGAAQTATGWRFLRFVVIKER